MFLHKNSMFHHRLNFDYKLTVDIQTVETQAHHTPKTAVTLPRTSPVIWIAQNTELFYPLSIECPMIMRRIFFAALRLLVPGILYTATKNRLYSESHPTSSCPAAWFGRRYEVGSVLPLACFAGEPKAAAVRSVLSSARVFKSNHGAFGIKRKLLCHARYHTILTRYETNNGII